MRDVAAVTPDSLESEITRRFGLGFADASEFVKDRRITYVVRHGLVRVKFEQPATLNVLVDYLYSLRIGFDGAIIGKLVGDLTECVERGGGFRWSGCKNTI